MGANRAPGGRVWDPPLRFMIHRAYIPSTWQAARAAAASITGTARGTMQGSRRTRETQAFRGAPGILHPRRE